MNIEFAIVIVILAGYLTVVLLPAGSFVVSFASFVQSCIHDRLYPWLFLQFHVHINVAFGNVARTVQEIREMQESSSLAESANLNSKPPPTPIE